MHASTPGQTSHEHTSLSCNLYLDKTVFHITKTITDRKTLCVGGVRHWGRSAAELPARAATLAGRAAQGRE
eukprot:2406025-Rhodomonas_salina.1